MKRIKHEVTATATFDFYVDYNDERRLSREDLEEIANDVLLHASHNMSLRAVQMNLDIRYEIGNYEKIDPEAMQDCAISADDYL
jgi:hypothetical protein